MKYSFYCPNCGDTFMSDDKKEVAKYRQNHRQKTLIGGLARRDVRMCPMVPVGKTGTIARPKLANFLTETATMSA